MESSQTLKDEELVEFSILVTPDVSPLKLSESNENAQKEIREVVVTLRERERALLERLATTETAESTDDEVGEAEELVKKLDGLSLTEEKKSLNLRPLKESQFELLRGLVSYAAAESATDEDRKKYSETFGSFGEFAKLRDYLLGRGEGLPDVFKSELTLLHPLVCKRFRILVLIDMGGTLFFRTGEKDVGKKYNFTYKRYKYFMRPGYKKLLRTFMDHPRVSMGFYSSIMRKNIIPILYKILEDDLFDLREHVSIFD